MPTPDKFERQHLRNINRLLRDVQSVYYEAIHDIVLVAALMTYKGQTFRLDKYPALQKRVNEVLRSMHTGLYALTVNSIKESWDLSNTKNNLFIDKRLAGRNPVPNVRKLLYDPNLAALDSFLKRKEAGLNLSERVWNSLAPFNVELEAGLGLGIKEGKSAADMARDLKRYLKQPDKLFRRVKQDGELKLSKPALAYKPGQGVYRSSYKNALRLTATETNIAYRSADHERWKNLPIIQGIEVHTSNNHPKYDICDELAGKYPKDFKFTGWHPNCKCYGTPILISDSQFNELEDRILGIESGPVQLSTIEEPPASFNKYIEDNAERIKGWKSKPYWVKDNKEYVSF
jgi:hypothetical protein